MKEWSDEVMTRPVKKITTTIPIVMATSGDPIGAGLIASLARPGGNVTGLSSVSADICGKRLQLLKESVPKVIRVASFRVPDKSSHEVRLTMNKAGWSSILVATILLAVAAMAEAQQPTKVTRIGYLSSQDPAIESARAEGILRALRELGYVEGRNIAIEYRYSEGKTDRAPELAAELVGLNVDIIVVAGGPSTTRAAKNASKTIPIVMMGVGADPVREGLVESLARPGGNVTGFTALTRELRGKRLGLLKEAVPKLANVAVLYDPAIAGSVWEVKEDLPVSARALGLTVRSWELRGADGFEKVFAALNKERPDGLYLPLGGHLINANIKRIVGFALKGRLPSMYSSRRFVDAGGLMYYGADLSDSYRRVAYFVDKILKGTKPADLPVEQSTKFELVINLKTAKQIGLTIPPNVLARADRVIR